MHRCLVVQEIIEQVARFAEDAHVATKGVQPPSVVLLQTCRSFYEAGCNVHWRIIPRFEPLWNIFSSDPTLFESCCYGVPIEVNIHFLDASHRTLISIPSRNFQGRFLWSTGRVSFITRGA